MAVAPRDFATSFSSLETQHVRSLPIDPSISFNSFFMAGNAPQRDTAFGLLASSSIPS